MQTANRRHLAALACPAALLVCELISRPWAEIGISDDWSYIRSAQLLAQTGHIHYVGWASAIVGWQFYLSGAFIKVLGFSFTAARLPTLLIALLTAYLMQRTLVRLGISEGNAVLGTLTFVLSPLFMMMSVTMMTDVPAFFSILACMYGCVRALQTQRDRDAILWLSFAVAVNIICGTSRQIAWLGVLVAVPSTLWLLRSRRRVFLYGLVAAAVGWVSVYGMMQWYAHALYALPGIASPRAFTLPILGDVAAAYDHCLLTLTLLLLPITVLYPAEVRHWRRGAYVLGSILAIVVGLIFYFILHIHANTFIDVKFLFSPFLGDWVGIHGGFDGLSLNGQQPPVLIGHAMHRLLGLVTAASLFSVIVTLATTRRTLPAAPSEPLSQRQLLWLFGPIAFAYAFLLLDRAAENLFDRYLFAPIFFLLFVILRFYQRRIRFSLPAISMVIVCLFAIWSIICTHNLFALGRARVVLDKEMVDAGIPSNAVDFGWEQNGWAALQQYPTVNSDKIANPPNTYIPIVNPQLPVCYAREFFGVFPHLAPRYGVAFDPHACAGPAPFAPVSYTSWPNLRPVTIYLVKYPPPWKAESDYAVPMPAR